jgi:ADP-ribose pyrophosphatase YjhB (NUDIX family)
MPNRDTVSIRLVVITLIEQNGKFLLIQESKPAYRNKWFFPGGRVSPGESLLEAALREAREESGLAVELTGLLYADQRIGSSNAGSAGRIRFVFLGKAAGGELKKTEDEHSIRAGWFSEVEIGGLELRSPFVRKLIDLYRRDPAILPIARINALSPEELLLERP